MEPRTAFETDLQASPPEVRIGLSRAGVTGVEKAITMRHGETDALVAATIDCFVDLDPAQKGVHMSRFPELFGEAIDEVVMGEKLRIENLAAHIAQHILDARAPAAEVKITARYPIERTTPVTALRTQELVTLIGLAAASPASTRRAIGVEATGITACPCAQGPSASAAGGWPRPGTRRGDRTDLRSSRSPPQPAWPGTVIGTTAIPRRELADTSIVRARHLRAPAPDELFVVEHAHLSPRFVEDSVRLMVKGALEAYGELRDEDFVLARQVNFETIHNHDVSPSADRRRAEAGARDRRPVRPPSSPDRCRAALTWSRIEKRARLLAGEETADARAMEDPDRGGRADVAEHRGETSNASANSGTTFRRRASSPMRSVTTNADPDGDGAEADERRDREQHAAGGRDDLSRAGKAEKTGR
jgi:GTP cyclohydrolase I/GTP cyclohydrolase-4